EKVAPGSLEELQHRLVFKRGRIGEVDHHLRAGHGLFEALAGDGVDAGIGRGGDDLVTALTQNGDGLRADQAGAADDNDLHGYPPKWVRVQEQDIRASTSGHNASPVSSAGVSLVAPAED